MERLTSKQLRQVSEFLRQLYQLRTHEEFTSHLIAALPTITEGEFTSYNEYPADGKAIVYKSDQLPYCPDPSHYATVLQTHLQEHPVVTHWRTTQEESAQIISDFVQPSQFRATTLYNEFYKPLKMSYLLFMGLKADNKRLLSISRHRHDREFRESDKTVFNAIRPHLQQALKNALTVTHLHDQLAAMDLAMEAGHRAMLSVSADGRIHVAAPYAHALLAQYGMGLKHGADWLPPVLRAWLRRQIRHLTTTDDVAPSIAPLTVTGQAGTLTIRLIPKGSQYLLTLKEDRSPTPPNLRHLGVSARETEILGWVVQGKTNPEIGIILGISRRTVQKHLERIYLKLGVENRHAAISLALSSMPGGA
ncbi:MAG: HTH luxR-type domain-containing protein [Nitrospira sp.]|nr:MAG: HTH luxR-type domain-containing protein [Nitrospira sp.]